MKVEHHRREQADAGVERRGGRRAGGQAGRRAEAGIYASIYAGSGRQAGRLTSINSSSESFHFILSSFKASITFVCVCVCEGDKRHTISPTPIC